MFHVVVVPASRYCISLLAYNDVGSGNTISKKITTPPAGMESIPLNPPKPPTNIDCENVDSSSVLLRWSDEHQVTSYTVCIYPRGVKGVNCNSSQAKYFTRYEQIS